MSEILQIIEEPLLYFSIIVAGGGLVFAGYQLDALFRVRKKPSQK